MPDSATAAEVPTTNALRLPDCAAACTHAAWPRVRLMRHKSLADRTRRAQTYAESDIALPPLNAARWACSRATAAFHEGSILDRGGAAAQAADDDGVGNDEPTRRRDRTQHRTQ
eukprot:6196395-Pleurochrysis_carterae.AAC.2